jgi:hypothetical protein
VILAGRTPVLILMAPVVFAAHVLEEAPRFVEWFNAHVARGISPELFRTVNLTALGITMLVVIIDRVATSRSTALLMLCWLSFLMPANALFHAVAALVDRAYVPGLVTAILLYVPYWSLLATRLSRERQIPVVVMAGAAAAGALPMLAHGFLIVFRGSRLF